MVLENPEKYNFYKTEREVKKGEESFKAYIDEIFKTKGLESTLTTLKISGLSVNIFDNSKNKKMFEKSINSISFQTRLEEIPKIKQFLSEIKYFDGLFKYFTEFREGYFKKFETIKDENKVVSYIIALDLFLTSLTTGQNKFKGMVLPEEVFSNHNVIAGLFDSAIESTGMILKYFMFKEYEFKGIKKNISPKVVEVSSKHMIFSENWNTLNDLLEYWMYSDIDISILENKKLHFDILDKNFELNNLISNERFHNLRQGWQMGQVGEFMQKSRGDKSISSDDILKDINSNLNYSFSVLYFGSPLLDVKIKNIKLNRWVYAYELLIDESRKFLKKRKEVTVLNLEKVCLSKSVFDWEKFFQRNDFTKTESKIIVKLFTFDNKCTDLIDSPLLKVDDNLIIIPSLTSQADVPRALASNFLTRGIDLDFKGPEFEERIKLDLSLLKIKNSGLSKKIDTEEYQCDIAFILDNELFLMECKAHVQPFTTRQHANHLFRLNEGTLQLKRIADFYERNISIVNEQLKVDADFVPEKVHRILLTTSMIGAPIFINGAYVVDESSFTMFIKRNPPSLKQIEKGSFVETPSSKFDIYEGELSAKKMIRFLKSPPQIQITKDQFQSIDFTINSFDFLSVRRHMKINETLHYGVNLAELKQIDENLTQSERSIINKYY